MFSEKRKKGWGNGNPSSAKRKKDSWIHESIKQNAYPRHTCKVQCCCDFNSHSRVTCIHCWLSHRLSGFFKLACTYICSRFTKFLHVLSFNKIIVCCKITFLKLIEIVNLWVYYTIPFGFSLFWYFLVITLQLFILYWPAKERLQNNLLIIF